MRTGIFKNIDHTEKCIDLHMRNTGQRSYFFYELRVKLNRLNKETRSDRLQEIIDLLVNDTGMIALTIIQRPYPAHKNQGCITESPHTRNWSLTTLTTE